MTTDLIGAIVEHDGERGRIRAVDCLHNQANSLVFWVQNEDGYLTAVDYKHARIVEVVQ